MSRGSWFAVAAAALAIALSSCIVPIPVPPPPIDSDPASTEPPGTGNPAGAAVAQFVQRLAVARERAGCPPLVWDAAVAAVAESHSRDMRERGYFSHTSPEGDDPFDRLDRAGIPFLAAAENVAYGQRTGDAVFAQWVGSPGHRDNMLNCTYTRQGVGRYGVYWTQVLIRPR